VKVCTYICMNLRFSRITEKFLPENDK
jgi:hypothetical protein